MVFFKIDRIKQFVRIRTVHIIHMYILTFLRYGTSTLTISFVDRIFQECLTYDGEVVSMAI